MSNFSTFGVVAQQLEGTAPVLFCASTPDSLADVLAAGYLDDKAALIKMNDLIFLNYADVSSFPLNVGEASVFGLFQVVYDPNAKHWSLVQANLAQGQSQLAAAGIHSATYNYAGGVTTPFTFQDARLNSSQIVLARWQSSANAVGVQKATVGNGSLTVLPSGDPGASVLEYIAITPSAYLESLGIHASSFSSSGVGATLTISDPSITANSVVNANFSSSANPVLVQKVTPSAGQLVVLCDGIPGDSVLDYVAVTPSVALTALGFYAAKASDAGGSATVTITDANITPTSIVSADIESSFSAVNVDKVTPGNGSLVILNSGDAGAAVYSYMATPVPE
jgi:hypothetical protein